MSKQTIVIGATANDGTGDPLRTAFDKCNDNFDELYDYDVNATTTALSLATLNATYPSVIVGHKVFCEDIVAGGLIYMKSDSGWVSIDIITVV